MKIQIKHRFTSSVLFECDKSSVKLAIELAVKKGAGLRGAGLRGADLEGAYLERADLRGACLRGADLEGADLSGADLEGADLRGACLRGADLDGAYLRCADLEGAYLEGAKYYNDEILEKEPFQLTGLKYFILITKKNIKIGCKVHTANEWFKFKDSAIAEMGTGALEWWKAHKSLIKTLWKKHCKEEK